MKPSVALVLSLGIVSSVHAGAAERLNCKVVNYAKMNGREFEMIPFALDVGKVAEVEMGGTEKRVLSVDIRRIDARESGIGRAVHRVQGVLILPSSVEVAAPGSHWLDDEVALTSFYVPHLRKGLQFFLQGKRGSLNHDGTPLKEEAVNVVCVP